MNKKVIIISIIAVILIAGGVVAFLFFTKQSSNFDPTGPPVAVVPLAADLSRDLKACTTVSKADVQSALGATAGSLQGPDNMGLISTKSGEQSQVCVFAFVTGGTINDSFNIGNAFSIEVFEHKDQASVDKDKTAKSVATVSGIGDAAYFFNTSTETTVRHELKVYSGLKHYTFTLAQPADQSAFSDSTARAALEAIATSANY